MFDLPEEYKNFVEKKEKFNWEELAEEYEPELENASFLPIETLKTSEMKVFTFDLKNDIELETDKEGHYLIDYVSLVDYEGALVWYPKLKCFGCLDDDHGKAFACKGASWSEISGNPRQYLVGMWEWDEGWDYFLDPSKEGFKFVEED